MNDAASAALSPESFSALALFLRADWVIKGVMLGLLGASLWSWSVIIDKLLKFRTLAQDADQIEEQSPVLPVTDGGLWLTVDVRLRDPVLANHA